MEALQGLADQGDAVAQFNLGQFCAYGDGGFPQDFGKAAVLYQQSANQGMLGAQFRLGELYMNGEGVPQDYGKAAVLYQQAADQGDGDALLYLALQRRELQHDRSEAEARAAAMAEELIRDEEQTNKTKGKQSKKKKKKAKGKGSNQAAQVKLSHLLALSIDTCVTG